MGSKYKKDLEADVPPSSIPTSLGGTYSGYNEPFPFDVSPAGLLAYPHRQYPFAPDAESSEGGDKKVSAEDVSVVVPEGNVVGTESDDASKPSPGECTVDATDV